MRESKYLLREFGIPEFGLDERSVADLARLHAELLGHSPLVLMGQDFMEEFYYRVLPLGSYVSGAIAYVNEEPAGFIVATGDPDGFMSRALKKHFFLVAWIMLKSVLKNPARILAMKEAWEIQANVKAEGYGPDIGELLSFGVMPEFRSRQFINESGLHISSDLLAVSIRHLRLQKKKTVRAIVDKDNLEAQFFYRANGWRVGLKLVKGWRVPTMEFLIDVE